MPPRCFSAGGMLSGMKLRYIFIPLLILVIAFVGVRYVNQRGSKQVIYSPSSPPLGCTRTTGTINTNIIGIGQPAGINQQGFVRKDLPYLQDLGIKWVRTDLLWPVIEKTKGNYTWKETDDMVRMLNENNIALLLIVAYVPQWVWDLQKKEDRVDAMYTFAKNFSARYRGKVRYYEVFNEPNLPGIGFFKAGERADAAVFLDFLAAANKGIHESDPDAVVVLGGLSPLGMPPGVPPATFLQKLYELGGKDCFDVLAYHPYDAISTQGTADNLTVTVDIAQKATELKNFVAQYNDSDKPIWFDEFGVNTNIVDVQSQIMNQIKNELSVVPGFFWFSLHDFGPSEMYGLLTMDYKKKPAYDLFKQIIKSQR